MIKSTTLNQCTACTSCLLDCPVAAATRKFPGPKLLGPGLERFRLFEKEVEAVADYCSNCKNCDISCPSNVAVSTLNMLAKNEYYKRTGHSLRDWMLSHGELFGKLCGPVAPLVNWSLTLPPVRQVLALLGLAKRPLPAYAARNFYQRFRALKQQRSANKVVFFPGCYIAYNRPQTGMDLVELLQAGGYEVVVPDFVCCGTPMVANGYLEEAGQKAEHNVRELAEWAGKGVPIVTSCTSCGLMLKQEYRELYDIKGSAAVAAAHFDAGEFLADLRETGRLPIDFAAMEGNFLYHLPCHLRAQGIGTPGLDLLQSIEGLTIGNIGAGCCGIAGSYGFKQEKYEIAKTIGRPLFEAVAGSPGAVVVTECGTCQLQIEQMTGAKTLHPVSLLRTALQVQ